MVNSGAYETLAQNQAGSGVVLALRQRGYPSCSRVPRALWAGDRQTPAL